DSRRTQGGARFLVVIGASGSGKSSLLKAGVLPQLARRPADWNLLPPMRPERGPLETLAKALAQHLGKPDTWREAHDKLKGNEPVAFRGEGPGPARAARALAATLPLPIDQFEEVFTIATPEERDGFLRLLLATFGRDPPLPFMIVATGRSDVLQGLLEAGDL